MAPDFSQGRENERGGNPDKIGLQVHDQQIVAQGSGALDRLVGTARDMRRRQLLKTR